MQKLLIWLYSDLENMIANGKSVLRKHFSIKTLEFLLAYRSKNNESLNKKASECMYWKVENIKWNKIEYSKFEMNDLVMMYHLI